MRGFLATVLALALAASLAAVVVVGAGLYDVSATVPHLVPTYRVIDVAARQGVRRQARGITPPALDDPAQIERGLALYRDHCVQCHGGPGVPPSPFALGLMPAAANLAHTAREWSAAEIYWTLRHGLKMTAMPAWEFRMPDADLWAVTAFVMTLPRVAPADYRRRAALAPAPAPLPEPTPLPAPDAQRGHAAIMQYACATCHAIPGVVGANRPVGPPLSGIGRRTILAGTLPNTRENMVRWLREPHVVNPLGAMPDLGVTERDARDMAEYLAALR